MDDEIGKTEHTGWDRGDYDVDQIGGFTEVQPSDGVDWREELESARSEVERLENKKRDEELKGHENDRLNWLRARVETIEAWRKTM